MPSIDPVQIQRPSGFDRSRNDAVPVTGQDMTGGAGGRSQTAALPSGWQVTAKAPSGLMTAASIRLARSNAGGPRLSLPGWRTADR